MKTNSKFIFSSLLKELHRGDEHTMKKKPKTLIFRTKKGYLRLIFETYVVISAIKKIVWYE